MGYVGASSTLPAAPASLLAAGLNQNLCTWLTSPAATEIELHLTAWIAEQLRLPSTAGGLVVSGGAVSTLVALKAARDRLVGWEVCAKSGPRLLFYTSDHEPPPDPRRLHSVWQGGSALADRGCTPCRRSVTPGEDVGL